MKRLLLIIALVLLGVLALVEQSERWTYSLWRALDRVPEAEALAHAGAPEPIAHAAGVVEGPSTRTAARPSSGRFATATASWSSIFERRSGATISRRIAIGSSMR